ncbi:MAG: hypothetical protein MZV64_28790 [Ignavibacteriales bacterium]|nr:hypothetical protein [Ignavibacteriales bacterium]
MEAQTREDVHILCLFDDRRQAERFNERIYALLPDVDNNPDFFGDQVVVDEQDNIVRQEEKLLLNALDVSIPDLLELVSAPRRRRHPRPCRGPALRPAGQPGHGPGRARRLRCWRYPAPSPRQQVLRAFPDLGRHPLLSNSDAHYPEGYRPGANRFRRRRQLPCRR